MKNELFMNNSTISPYKYTFLLAILLITIIASISPLNSFAQEENKKERGWNGKITKAELLQKLRNLKEDEYSLEDDEYVEGYIINGSDIIEIIKESDIDIKIDNSVIEGGLDFTKLPPTLYVPFIKEKRQVNNHIELKNSKIGFLEEETSRDEENRKISVYSGNNLFHKLISFRETQFSEKADFLDAQFRGKADFYKAQFSGEADFWDANLQGADLRGADLQGADLRVANLKRANFWEADLHGARLGEADLQGANLFGSNFGSTYLWLSNLGEAKNIRYINWGEKYVVNRKLIIFLNSKFPKAKYKINMPQIISSKEYHSQGDFINALDNSIKIKETKGEKVKKMILEKERDKILLQNKQSISEIALISPKSERYIIGEEKSGDFEKAEITYRDLKSFYKERKMHNIASEFHYRENVVKTKLSYQPIRIFRTVFLDWTYGYGSRPLRLIPFCFGVILVFAFIYFLLTLPRKTDSGIYVVTNDGRKEELLPIREGKILLDCLYFSLLSFATFGYGALQPKQWLQFFYLEPVEFKPRRWARIFVGFEAAIGIYLLALTALVLFKG